jgi:hypothetical protein
MLLVLVVMGLIAMGLMLRHYMQCTCAEREAKTLFNTEMQIWIQ